MAQIPIPWINDISEMLFNTIRRFGHNDLSLPVIIPSSVLNAIALAEARIGAAYALGAMGEDAIPAIPALTENLHHQTSRVQIAAMWALGKIGPASQEATADIAELLTSSSLRTIQIQAAITLREIGDRSTVPSLFTALYDEDSYVAQTAAESIVTLLGEDNNFDANSEDLVFELKEWWEQKGQSEDWTN